MNPQTILNNSPGLHGKNILITGGSSGIGRGAVDVLLAAGARVAIASRRIPPELPEGVLALTCDVSDPEQVDAAVAETVQTFGGLHGLFANAGMVIFEEFLTMSNETWRKTMSVNLDGVFYATRAAARHMAQNGGGAIVTTSSVRAVASSPLHAAYSATKGAVDALVVQLATELGPLGIRINSIQAGAVSSEMLAHAARLFADGDSEKLNASFLHMIPLNRIGTPAEIGSLAAFLLSDAASYITGACIPADGGMLARLV